MPNPGQMNRKMTVGKGKPKLDVKVVGRLLKLLFRDYPGKLACVFICIIVNAVVGVMPAVYIETITSYIVDGLAIGKAAGFAAAWEQTFPRVTQAVLVMGCLYVVGLTAMTIREQLTAIITQGFLDKMRRRMFDRMQDLPVRFFDANNHGDIMSYYTNDIDTLRQLISQGIPSVFNAAVTLLVLVCVMFYFSVSLMLVVFVGVIVITQITKFVGGNSAKFFIRQQQSMGKTEGYVEEMMNGQKVVKVFCHEPFVKTDFDKVNEVLFKDMESAHTFSNIFGPIMNNIGNILYVVTAFVGGLIITNGWNNFSLQNIFAVGAFAAPLSISVVASYLGMCKQFMGQVNQASQQINSIAMAMAGADRIFKLIDEEPEPDEGYVTLVNCTEENGVVTECAEHTGHWAWKHPHAADGTVTYTPLRGDVVLDHVDFSYVPEKPVLHDITLYAKPGQKVAFVGATGAGKTTITNLINRFYDIEDGKIRYDGININKIKKDDLRRSLGVVLQDVNLFTGTVMDNIRYGKLDATDEECIAAAKLANAHDFITRLPEGYNTMLTANGANLSQGQRQLISIARAAVADPPVMILDEATSSIDTRTELLVQRGMDALMKGRTVFVIAHRLSTVQNSDAIMVLDHGRIIERGSHADLIAKKGTYYSLYTGAFELE
ncbi:MAG: ABC transporter ATP-binding protein [Clostridia bacterium]|nr:ABC transporter ATP-binding protein [Clostridia bacterium]